jgi:hypothetical protein
MNNCCLVKFKSNLFIIGFVFVFLLSSCGSGGPLFKSQSKKGPNIYSSKPPRTKSRNKLYGHSISKKKTKRKGSIFSTKKRYGSFTTGSGGKSKGDKSSKGGRKSGKGRKKEK